MLTAMIRQIAPQFFTTDLLATLAYYNDKLGFDCVGTWQDPPVYAIVARDHHRINFRCAETPAPNPDKYDDELLANTHFWGNPAAESPVFHLRSRRDGGIAANLLRSFERVWDRAQPLAG